MRVVAPPPKELLELLSASQHDIWASWQHYLFSRCVAVPDMLDHVIDPGALIIPASLVERWTRQINMPYVELSEGEKESDREQVMKYWPLFVDFVAEWLTFYDDLHDPYTIAMAWRDELEGCS